MALKMGRVKKLTTLSLSRATTPLLTEQEKIERLEKVVERMKARLKRRQANKTA